MFRVSTPGSERIVYSFKGPGDGCRPDGSLALIKGVLYGVTAYGGGIDCDCGTVFKVSETGAERVIYRFKGERDGVVPLGLIGLKGELYGLTVQGGGECNASRGCGTIFKVTIAGEEEVLHRFKGGSDGGYPQGALLSYRGTLYGTTAGGYYSCGVSTSFGCGAVFKISP